MDTRLILLGLSLLMASSWGCEEDQTFSKVLDDVMDSVPEVCREYCEESVECEWEGDGSHEDEALETAIRECSLDCAYHMTNGCMFSKYTEDQADYSETTEYLDHLSGENALEVFECIWGLNLHRCEEFEEGFSIFWIMDREKIKSSSDCQDLQDCQNLFEIDPVPSFYWEENEYLGDYCYGEITSESDEDYFIMYGVTCGEYFPNV